MVWAKLLLLGACAVVATQGALLGSTLCYEGPAYWCHSLFNAKECGAVKHCIQSVWEQQLLPEDNDDVCKICKDMVKEARENLLSNSTQELIQQVFEGSCKLIPVDSIQKECIQLADEYIPELVEMLASQMNPQVVCAAAGLCNSARIDIKLREYKKKHGGQKIEGSSGDSQQCVDCTTFIKDVIHEVKSHSKTDLLDKLLSVCGRLGSLSDGCMALVQANFETIYEFITEKLDPKDFCNLAGMCSTITFPKRPNAPERTGDEPCDFCVAIVQHWRDVLIANTTEEEFRQILVGICKQTGKFAGECLSLVGEYYIPLYQFLVSEVRPKEICEAVGLCGIRSIFGDKQTPVWTLFNLNPKDTLPLVQIKPPLNKLDSDHLIGTDEANAVRMENSKNRPDSEHLIGTDEANAIRMENSEPPFELPHVKLTRTDVVVKIAGQSGVLAPEPNVKSISDDICVMCEFVLHFLQTVLQENSTREEIKEAVENVCKLMPHTISEQCQDYVDAYGDQVIQLLILEIDPSVICPMIHLCPPKEVGISRVMGNDDVSCVMCEYAMTQLEDMLKDNKTEENIKNALDKLCMVLPKTVTKECLQFVNSYTDQIIHLLINDLTPDQVCIALHLCKKPGGLTSLNPQHQLPLSRMFIPPVQEQRVVGGTKLNLKQSDVCFLCEFIVTALEDMLVDNATMDEIEKAVKYVCIHLPGTIKEDCIGFIEEYGDALIKLLANEIKPRQACQYMELCKPSGPNDLVAAVVDLHINKCAVCEDLVSDVDEWLKHGDVTVDIDAFLEKVCTIFPQKVRSTCRDLIEVYGPYLANLLAEVTDSKLVCQAIDICPQTTTKPLIGAEKCTWGPAYWCQTKLHAEACKATQHCEENVWGEAKPSA